MGLAIAAQEHHAGPVTRVLVLTLLFVVALGPMQPAAATPVEEDLELLDGFTVASSAGHGAAGLFGTTSVSLGVAELVMIPSGRGSFFSGLTYLLWGGATIASAAVAMEQELRTWGRARRFLQEASPARRRMFRAEQGLRLRRAASNRAIGLVADGTAMGIGIALVTVPQSRSRDMGEALLADGAFLLAVDLFRTVLDDQIGLQWLRRNDAEAQGYFGSLPPPTLVATPILASPSGQAARGVMVGVTGRF